MKLFRVFTTGLFISFLGTLPLGALNMAAMQISVSDGVRPALKFAIGALIVEMIYVRISLVAMDWVRKRKKLFRYLEWATVIIIAALAVTSFIAAADPQVKKNVILSNSLPRFWLGASMSAINPVQIPFWFGWSAALFSKGILQPRNNYYNIYIAGIGMGTLTGFAVFIFGGLLIVNSLKANQSVVQWIIGSIFAITAIIMFLKIITKKEEKA